AAPNGACWMRGKPICYKHGAPNGAYASALRPPLFPSVQSPTEKSAIDSIVGCAPGRIKSDNQKTAIAIKNGRDSHENCFSRLSWIGNGEDCEKLAGATRPRKISRRSAA